MAYTVLGINPQHNGAAAVISDGELIYYLEEERFSKMKWDGNPFRVIIDICSKYTIDEVIIGGTGVSEDNYLPWTLENPYFSLVRKFNPKAKWRMVNNKHHLCHAYSTFFNSGFDEAAILICDGAGSKHGFSIETHNPNDPGQIESFECESIFKGNNKGITTLYKSLFANRRIITYNEGEEKYPMKFDDSITLTKTYEAVTYYLGWSPIEAGKTMGLAPYGKFNSKIPPLFKNGRGDRNIFYAIGYPGHVAIDQTQNPEFRRINNPKDWHKNPSKLTDFEKDLAWHIQKDTQEEVAKLIEKAIELTSLKKVCIGGGYGLNCVTNYWVKKRFPNIEFFHDPVSHDGGTAIGAAVLGWNHFSNKFKPQKTTSFYLGPKYTTNQYLKTLKNYTHNFNQYQITPEQVAKLISERNIVTIFQGRSEAGPRALGNRSILYDPTDPNGKDFVNKVKNREWFRPFAGTVLLEKANEWFDMAGLEESPFMMYAMDVWPNKQEQIQAITHVDGTCRIQTVTEEQNLHYYKLIQEFEKITGVPILFNTSFNLAGDPLVETIEDALKTLLKSELKYLYLPELEMLLEKK